MKIAIVGATGLVGSKILEILEERNFPISEIIPVASEKSIGKKITFQNANHTIVDIRDAIASKPTIAFFSAGGTTAQTWAPEFAGNNTTVIDNSSAWRMHPQIKLVVPEINGDVLTADDKIIANPNCSTIQMVMALNPLHKLYKIKRVVVSTYQSVSGSGMKSVNQLNNERQLAFAETSGQEAILYYPHPIDLNVIPQVDIFLDNLYTREEMKMVNETRKIMRDETIQLTATAVRVPVIAGHSESINVTFERDFDLDDIRHLLATTPGVTLIDNPAHHHYPIPLHAAGKDDVFVGRIRRDESQKNSLNLWVVSDNLRKGAATNAVQIAEYMLTNGLV